MHLIASALVELFPKLQILDLVVLPDRFIVDFSFSRGLDLDELKRVKERFFEKVRREEKGAIREMVSKNACDMLKHHKQVFLTELVDREEMFCDMFCMDVYNAPLIGEIDQDECGIKEVKLKTYDHGEKKWSKKKVHHYSLEGFSYYSKFDRKEAEKAESTFEGADHVSIGKLKSLFWVSDEGLFFSDIGESEYEKLIDKAKTFFGPKVFFDSDPELFSELSGLDAFLIEDEFESDELSSLYGLKASGVQRGLSAFSFSNSNLKRAFKDFSELLGLEVSDDFVAYDYRGIPWEIALYEEEEGVCVLEIYLQTIFALLLEKKG